LPSPISGSSAKAVVQGPPWLLRLLTPLFARHIARGLAARHPGLGPQEIGALMRADLGPGASADHLRLVDAVVARVPSEVEQERPVSAWVLVAANLVPLVGVLWWDWSVFALLALFWMENVVIGALFALRMLCADPRDPAMWAGKLFLIPFFCVHYGMFTAVHGIFVFLLFGGDKAAIQKLELGEAALRAAERYDLWLPIGVLIASHAFSFFWNYLYRGEFRRAQLSKLMAQPYGRVMVLHVAILLGGFGTAMLGSPVWALVLLVVLKTGLDYRAHVKEHSKA
jgi:hypothetical protein